MVCHLKNAFFAMALAATFVSGFELHSEGKKGSSSGSENEDMVEQAISEKAKAARKAANKSPNDQIAANRADKLEEALYKYRKDKQGQDKGSDSGDGNATPIQTGNGAGR